VFQTKVGFKKTYLLILSVWITSPKSGQGHIDFFYGSPYFYCIFL